MHTDINNGITIVGLGPGKAENLTVEAWQWLEGVDKVYLRTLEHPSAAGIPPNVQKVSFDELYRKSTTLEEVYREIVETILTLGRQPGGVTFAVPGHPFIAEATCVEIVMKARKAGIPVRIIEGISLLEPVCRALEIDPFPQMAIIDALEFSGFCHPPFPPSQPVLVAQVYSNMVASEVKLVLMAVYPDDYRVRLVHYAGTEEQIVETLPLYEVDRSPHIGLQTCLYVPPLDRETSFEAFQDLVARLRAPDGCTWDREQTHQSLRNSLLEETYEVLSALDAGDMPGLQEELGDLLLQLVLHAQIGVEEGEFSMTDILAGIHQKIVYRHPHVFANKELDGPHAILRNWEQLKAAERKASGKAEHGLLHSVPKALPALAQAQAYQDRAARVGFDWNDITPVYRKVKEELAEVREAKTNSEREDELGDLLFSLVNLVRWHKADAESVLRKTNDRFSRRFAYVEERAREAGKNLHDMSLEEMDAFWNEAKTRGL